MGFAEDGVMKEATVNTDETPRPQVMTPREKLELADAVLGHVERLFPAADYAGQEEGLALALIALVGGAYHARDLVGGG